jgi:hypothetical protein
VALDLLCAALRVIAVQALRPGPPPYVLEINNATGEPIGAVAPVLGTQIIPDPAIRWELKEFIEYAFRVDKDFDEEKAAPHHVYATTTGQAASALTAWYRADKANDPLLANSKGWQEVSAQWKNTFRAQPTKVLTEAQRISSSSSALRRYGADPQPQSAAPPATGRNIQARSPAVATARAAARHPPAHHPSSRTDALRNVYLAVHRQSNGTGSGICTSHSTPMR